MRHLFVTNDFPPKLGGIESYLTSLAKGFDPEEIAVVAPAREGWEDVDAELPYEVYRVRGTYLRATRILSAYRRACVTTTKCVSGVSRRQSTRTGAKARSTTTT